MLKIFNIKNVIDCMKTTIKTEVLNKHTNEPQEAKITVWYDEDGIWDKEAPEWCDPDDLEEALRWSDELQSEVRYAMRDEEERKIEAGEALMESWRES